MFSIARLYNSACSYSVNPIRIYPIFMSIIFDNYKKLSCKIEKNKCDFKDRKNIVLGDTISIVDSTVLTREIESWHKFSDCLRRNNKELFEQMLQPCYKYSSSISAKGEDHATEALLMTLLFEQYKPFKC